MREPRANHAGVGARRRTPSAVDDPQPDPPGVVERSLREYFSDRCAFSSSPRSALDDIWVMRHASESQDRTFAFAVPSTDELAEFGQLGEDSSGRRGQSLLGLIGLFLVFLEGFSFLRDLFRQLGI